MTPPDAKAELLPCPFCGGDNINSGHIRDGRSIGCRGCGAAVHAFQPSAEAEARRKWNLRASQPETSGWRSDMENAPKDGTHILAIIHREACKDMDGIRRKAFSEVREIFYQPYRQFGMDLPWHAGDPFDSHEGMAPEHFGEAVPIAWMPRSALPTPPVEGG